MKPGSLDIREISKNVLFRAFTTISEAYRDARFILVLDTETIPLISSLISMSELTRFRVALIEQYDLKRQPLLAYQAIYILSPKSRIEKFIDDFDREPLYSAPHLMFSYSCTPAAHDSLVTKKDIVAKLLTFMDLFIVYVPIDRNYFTTSGEYVLETLYGNNPSIPMHELSTESTRGIISLFLGMKAEPKILFPSNDPKILQYSDFFREQFRSMKGIITESDPNAKFSDNSLLVILPRGFDTITPLLHQFFYMSMVQENLPIKNNKISFGDESKSVYLNPFEDPLFEELQYKHFQEMSQILNVKRTQFADLQKQLNETPKTLPDGKANPERSKIIKQVAQFKTQADLISNHLDVAHELSQQMKARNLVNISMFEQKLITKVDQDAKKYKASLSDLGQMLSSTNDPIDKVRLLCLYVLSGAKTNKSELDRLIQNHSIDQSLLKAVENISKIGGGMKRDLICSPEQNVMVTDRFLPGIIELAQKIMDGKVSDKEFVLPEKYNLSRNIVFFIVGGMTYFEMTSLNNFGKKSKDTKFYLGSNFTITPSQFIKQVSSL